MASAAVDVESRMSLRSQRRCDHGVDGSVQTEDGTEISSDSVAGTVVEDDSVQCSLFSRNCDDGEGVSIGFADVVGTAEPRDAAPGLEWGDQWGAVAAVDGLPKPHFQSKRLGSVELAVVAVALNSAGRCVDEQSVASDRSPP